MEYKQQLSRILELREMKLDDKFENLKNMIENIIDSYLDTPHLYHLSKYINEDITRFNEVIIRYLLRDLYYVLEKLNNNDFLYVDLIIRQMYEHIVEYCYIIETEDDREDLIKSYLGYYTDCKDLSDKTNNFSLRNFSNDITKIAKKGIKKKNQTYLRW